MKNLRTPTGLHIGSRWIPAGETVPGDVASFNYEKAARKGLIEDTEGAEIRNVQPTGQAPAQAAEAPAAGRTFTEEEFGRVQRDRDELHQSLATAQQKLKDAETQLTQARQSAADPADVAALAEYRDVVGELLPASFPSRKVLLDNGYYTLDSVRYADDDALKAIDGIGDGRLAEIRKVAPLTISEE
ncbi:hypothetical protein [Deinococcus soli (ex Cha et al. 2016)]|uniref:hypothetical protein n=1 Tax=Deinococcus soli (ex Cha et al. 2016) TaxID=1309411 RepID=UPI00166968BA|nr:hypothetical protein [Deinococcus soli (ex Cha et al. 2016)]GGB64490.1 hypothetical protein GCM10008019_20730 [Deinococcus soli (ex Cha et al. 2016)]